MKCFKWPTLFLLIFLFYSFIDIFAVAVAVASDIDSEIAKLCLRLGQHSFPYREKVNYGIEIESVLRTKSVSTEIYATVASDIKKYMESSFPDVKIENFNRSEKILEFLGDDASVVASITIGSDGRSIQNEIFSHRSISFEFHKALSELKLSLEKGTLTPEYVEEIAKKYFAMFKNRVVGNELLYHYKGHRYLLKFVPDMSVSIESGRSLEIVSPVLGQVEGDDELFFKVVNFIKKKYSIDVSDSAGQHVHVGFFSEPLSKKIENSDFPIISKEDAGQLKFLVTIFKKIYPDIRSVNNRPNIDMYAAIPDYKKLEKFIDSLSSEKKNVDIISEISRHQALNLQSLIKHGTVEIRIYDSSLDSVTALKRAKLWQYIVSAVKSEDDAFIDYVAKHSSLKVEELMKFFKLD